MYPLTHRYNEYKKTAIYKKRNEMSSTEEGDEQEEDVKKGCIER